MKINQELLTVQSLIIGLLILLLLTLKSININPKPKFTENDLKIDINTADIITLQRIPYIGEKTAELIIEDRKIRGGYTDINQLKWVKNFDKIKPYIKISEEAKWTE
jgi:DNA uptake protein and related DNA-binding proteins